MKKVQAIFSTFLKINFMALKKKKLKKMYTVIGSINLN